MMTYEKWLEHSLDYDWWDSVYEMFTQDCAEIGVTVEDMQFSLGHAGAQFEGWVDVGRFMVDTGLAVDYPALYLAVVDMGSSAHVSMRRSSVMLSWDSYDTANSTAPSGMFRDLDQDAWSELVVEQNQECKLEEALQEFCDDLCRKLMKTLEKEADYLTSEDVYKEWCECNEETT